MWLGGSLLKKFEDVLVEADRDADLGGLGLLLCRLHGAALYTAFPFSPIYIRYISHTYFIGRCLYSCCRPEPTLLKLLGVTRVAPTHVLDVGAPVPIQSRAPLPFSLLTLSRAPLDHGLKVVRVVCRQRLERFPSRTTGDEAAAVAPAAAPTSAPRRGRSRPLAARDVLFARPLHATALLPCRGRRKRER